MLASVLDRPWVTDAGFFALPALAPESRNLMLQIARRYPALALREYRTYIASPIGREVFEQAVMADPEEAVGLASGRSAHRTRRIGIAAG